MTKLEDSFLRHFGFYPTYMRMPFLMFNDVALSAMADLGYHIIGASIDTKDYEHDDPGSSWISFEKFKAELSAGGDIVLAHDVHQTTTEVLVDNMLEEIRGRGLKSMLFLFLPRFCPLSRLGWFWFGLLTILQLSLLASVWVILRSTGIATRGGSFWGDVILSCLNWACNRRFAYRLG